MNIQLSDIAKYAYGSGFGEGVNGGRGFLTIDGNGLLTKVYTHRADAKKLDTLENDQFQKLRSGTDSLATRLYELAQGKGMSPAALARVRTLLGLSEDGTARVVDGRASHAQQLLSRRVVASVVSLIDPQVWERRNGGQTIAACAAEVSSRGIVTNGQDVLREKEEISRLVGTILTDEATDGLSAEMVKKLDLLFTRELSKLRPDGSQVESGATVYRSETARVILPRFLAELKNLVRNNPRAGNLDLTGVNLLPVLRALPKTDGAVVTEKRDGYNIVIKPEKDDRGRALIGKIIDHDDVHRGAIERFNQLLPHLIRQAIANGAANPKGQVFVSYEKGELSLSLSPVRKALEAEVFKLARKTVQDEKLSDGEKKRFEALLHDFMDAYTEMFIGNAKVLDGFNPRIVGANLSFLARLSRDGDPKLHDTTNLQSAFLARLARGHERLAARLLTFCPLGDCGAAIRILSNDAYVNELETTPLNRARIYQMVIGDEPTDELDTMSHQEFASKLDGDWGAHFTSTSPDPGYASIVMGTVQGRGGMIFKDGTLTERLLEPLDKSLSISMQDVRMKPIPYVVSNAMKSDDADTEKRLLDDVNRDRPTFKIGGQPFSYPRSGAAETDLTTEDLKPLFNAIDKLGSTPQQRRVSKNLLGQGGLEAVMIFALRLGSERSLAYDVTKDKDETIHVKAHNLGPDNIQFKFEFEIKTTGENEMIDFSYEERPEQAS